MDYVFPLALLFFFVVLIGGAYYLDFKTDPKEFKFSIKAAAFGLKQYLFSIIGGVIIFAILELIFNWF